MVGKFLSEDRDRKYFKQYENRRWELLEAISEGQSEKQEELTKLDFGCHIYSLRRTKSLSQGEFASKLNISRETVNRIENGKQLPHPQNIMAMAKILQTSEARLFKKSKIPYKTDVTTYEEDKDYEQIIDSFLEAENLEEFIFQCVLIWKKIKPDADDGYDLSYLDKEFKEAARKTNIETNLVNLSKIIIETFTPETVMNLIREILVGEYSVYLQGDSKARKVMIETAADLERFAKIYPKSKQDPNEPNEIPVVPFDELLK